MAGRILIADPTPTNRIILKVGLATARYQTVQASDGGSARKLARKMRPDLIILNARLPDADGAEICARLKQDPATRAIPVLIIDAAGSRAGRLAALRAGADDYLSHPVHEGTLLALVRNLMRTRATFDELVRRQDTIETLGFAEATEAFSNAARIAVIAPTPETGLIWRRGLGAMVEGRVSQMSKEQALDGSDPRAVPDAYIIAADIGAHNDGLMLISELRSRPASRHAAIIVLDEAFEPATVPMALDLGANAVVGGSFDAEELAARLAGLVARKRETDALRESFGKRLDLAARDSLTGLYNRRYAEAYLARISEESARTGQPFAVMLIDLDRFKSVNDSHGHPAGDAVLKETARRLRTNLREIDLVARYGGEEFLVALPETDLASAALAAERLRRVIGETPVVLTPAGTRVTITASIGVTLRLGAGDSATPAISALVSEADRALYASKREGRNAVSYSAAALA